MTDWRIKDYKTRCFNLQNRIKPFSADMETIEKTAKAIRKKNNCDELTALRTLKKRLEEKLAKQLRQ